MVRNIRSTLKLVALLGSAALIAPVAGFADPAANPPAAIAAPQATPAPAKPAPEDRDAKRKADRQAFFAARLAALHAGLQLKPDQDALWSPVETAIRDLAATRGHHWHARRDDMASSADRLKAMADHLVKKGEAMKKLADAAGPLLAVLTPDQKERLPILLRGVGARHVLAQAFDLQNDRGPRDHAERGDRDPDRGGMDRGGMDRGGMERGGMDRGEMEGGERFGHRHFADRDDRGFGHRDFEDRGLDGRGMDGRGDGDGGFRDRRGWGHGWSHRDERADDGDRADRYDDRGPTRHRHHHDDDDSDISLRS